MFKMDDQICIYCRDFELFIKKYKIANNIILYTAIINIMFLIGIIVITDLNINTMSEYFIIIINIIFNILPIAFYYIKLEQISKI